MNSLILRRGSILGLLLLGGFVALPPAVGQTVTKKSVPAAAAPRTLSVQRLKKLAMELMMYTQDNNAYPAMQNPAVVRKALAPYGKASDVFLEPGVNKPYLPNPHLSGLHTAQVKAPGDIVAFYEPVAASDGSRLICTADGRVLTAPGTKWVQVKHIFRLP